MNNRLCNVNYSGWEVEVMTVYTIVWSFGSHRTEPAGGDGVRAGSGADSGET